MFERTLEDNLFLVLLLDIQGSLNASSALILKSGSFSNNLLNNYFASSEIPLQSS